MKNARRGFASASSSRLHLASIVEMSLQRVGAAVVLRAVLAAVVPCASGHVDLHVPLAVEIARERLVTLWTGIAL